MEETRTKRCRECGEVKCVTEFHRRRQRNGELTGFHGICKGCQAAVRKRYYKPHSKIRHQLGLTQEQVDIIVAPQCCAGCGRGPTEVKLCIDHDHKTLKIRGLLCHSCNTALGLLQSDTVRMLKLSRYLEQPGPLD